MVGTKFDFDVGLSFAGEQREYVNEVARHLKARGVSVFYDDYERGTLWGKDLYAYLSDVYKNKCRYCIIFVSAAYAKKVWTVHEQRSAQARAVEESREYILPVRFDDTELPGLLNTVGYIDVDQTSSSKLADLIVRKLGKRAIRNIMPQPLDHLHKHIGVASDYWSHVDSHADAFYHTLRRMTPTERSVVTALVRYGCPSDLPDNLHIDTDLLRRYTGKSVAQLQRILGGVSSLGFECSLAEAKEHEPEVPGKQLGHTRLFYLAWSNFALDAPPFPEMEVVSAMIECATGGLCDECGASQLERLDFSQLSSETARDEFD